MRYYPIFINLKGCPVVVVGGGSVAERKVATLLKAGADITLISPSLTRRLAAWSAGGRIKEIRRSYRSGDLGGAVLAFTATDSSMVNQAVAREASKKKILINVADQSTSKGFIVPALFAKKDFMIAVSTGGKSPTMAKKMRDHLKTFFSTESAASMDKLGKTRRKLIRQRVAPTLRRKRSNEREGSDQGGLGHFIKRDRK
jgi:precorrin-2 dehydrogenase / sirohydrochlorin ferrochelatase